MKENTTDIIYEYSQSHGEVRLLDHEFEEKEKFDISIPNVSLVIIWGVFLIVIHQQGTKLMFTLLSRQTLKNLQTIQEAIDDNKKELKYFSKPFIKNEVVMEDTFENRDNVN